MTRVVHREHFEDRLQAGDRNTFVDGAPQNICELRKRDDLTDERRIRFLEAFEELTRFLESNEQLCVAPQQDAPQVERDDHRASTAPALLHGLLYELLAPKVFYTKD